MKAIVYQDTALDWRWRLKAKNGRTIADSGEGYGRRDDCLKSLALVLNCTEESVKVVVV